MECCGRRGRRGRNRSRQLPCFPHNFHPSQSKPWSFLSGFYSFFIMSSLMAIIYLMLEYHCSACAAKCDLNGITRNIDDIAKNLKHIKEGYRDLENQISKFSQELPKLEGQIEILDTLANAIEGKDIQWNPRNHVTFPNVDVYLTKTENGKNNLMKEIIIDDDHAMVWKNSEEQKENIDDNDVSKNDQIILFL